MASTADDEYVQLTIPEAFIYKCPPRASASGYRAAEMTEQVAIVRVVVATKGHDVLLRLFRADTDKLFAMCPLRRGGPPGLEPVTDSSRYFCLRLENEKGNHAFVGLGFNRREDAFDLKSSIADAQKQAEAELAGAGAGICAGGRVSTRIARLARAPRREPSACHSHPTIPRCILAYQVLHSTTNHSRR